MRRFLTLALLAPLLALAAGCASPDESRDAVGEEVNNLPQAQGGADMGDEGTECISTTSGAPTSGSGDNPCPQGQYPSGS